MKCFLKFGLWLWSSKLGLEFPTSLSTSKNFGGQSKNYHSMKGTDIHQVVVTLIKLFWTIPTS